jgi:hypothetical protein
MTKNLLLFLLLLPFLSPVFSQFNEQLARKSLVRVQVTAGREKGILSGFFWKDPSQIITALHGMKPNGEIKIYYPNGAASEAKVTKVFKAGDLVLLQVTSPPSGDFAVISAFQEKVTTGEKLTAIGYYGGAQSKTTQSFDKGSADPETVRGIAPLALEKEVAAIQFPSIDFNIYYVSGSLLPGFSGCPVYNNKMELIGIGDGGLDKGQTNVSWCIPAVNITKLESSSVTALPENLTASGMNYTSDVFVEDNGDQGTLNKAEDKPQKYESFASGDFDFYLTKTRTWNEMKKTTIDSENMESLVKAFADRKLNVDCNEMYFDIYEDINNGFVIAIPELATLHVLDKEKNIFGVQLSDLDMEKDDANKYFELYYFTSDVDGDPVTQLLNFIKSDFTPDNGGQIELEPESTKTYKIDDEWTADYRAFNATKALDNPDLGKVVAIYYINVIHNKEVAFNSIAAAYIPEDRTDLIQALEKGADCIGDYDNNVTVCDFYESFVKVIAAAHLTTVY